MSLTRNLSKIAPTAAAWGREHITVSKENGVISTLTVDMEPLLLIVENQRESFLTLAVESVYIGLPSLMEAAQKIEESEDLYSICSADLDALSEHFADQDVDVIESQLKINLRRLSFIVSEKRNCVLGMAVGKAYGRWIKLCVSIALTIDADVESATALVVKDSEGSSDFAGASSHLEESVGESFAVVESEGVIEASVDNRDGEFSQNFADESSSASASSESSSDVVHEEAEQGSEDNSSSSNEASLDVDGQVTGTFLGLNVDLHVIGHVNHLDEKNHVEHQTGSSTHDAGSDAKAESSDSTYKVDEYSSANTTHSEQTYEEVAAAEAVADGEKKELATLDESAEISNVSENDTSLEVSQALVGNVAGTVDVDLCIGDK